MTVLKETETAKNARARLLISLLISGLGDFCVNESVTVGVCISCLQDVVIIGKGA